MKVVIDIPDAIMEYVKNNGCLSVNYDDEVAKAIINGTPLPKRHGRLIDADYIKLFSINHDSWNGVEYEGVIKVIPVIAIDNAPTIIEADKEVDNEVN